MRRIDVANGTICDGQGGRSNRRAITWLTMRNSFLPDVNAMTFCRDCGLLRLWTSGQTPGSPEHSLGEDIDCIFTSQCQFEVVSSQPL